MAKTNRGKDPAKEGLPTPVWVIGVIIFVLTSLYLFSG